MSNEYKNFNLQRKKANIIADFIIAIIWLFTVVRSFISTEKHTEGSLVILVISSILIIGLLYYDIYKDYVLKKKKISDLSISAEDIIIPYGFFLKPKIFLIKDIIEIYTPKWDNVIEISFKDKSKIKLNLYNYADKDKQELKAILGDIKGVSLKSEKIKAIPKIIRSFHIVNGKKYIK
ncbi:MAG TPA: hypothetical protein VIK72_10330 [Clostridiaceae bacterium]